MKGGGGGKCAESFEEGAILTQSSLSNHVKITYAYIDTGGKGGAERAESGEFKGFCLIFLTTR